MYEDVAGPFKGRLRKKKLEPAGDVRVLNPEPIWVGMKDGSNIKHYMDSEHAENWLQQGTDRRVRLYMQKKDLDRL